MNIIAVACRLTGGDASAIAVIGIAGAEARSLVESFVQPAKTRAIGRIYYGTWQLEELEAAEQVVLCQVADDRFEIHCHGGKAVVRALLQSLRKRGCATLNQHEWEQQIRQGLCRITAEANEDLIEAKTQRTAQYLLAQWAGAQGASPWCKLIERWKTQLESGEWQPVQSEIAELLSWSRFGLHLSKPWRVVLAGPPNVGKSSLINGIAGQEHSIVHHEPGTTRDWVEVQTAVDGWPITLTDTAGLRETAEFVEAEGIRRAWEQVSTADLVAIVVAADVGWTELHTELVRFCHDRKLANFVLWNKSDLQDPPNRQWLAVSANTAAGVAELLEEIASRLVPERPPVSEPIPFRERHVEILRAAQASLQARDMAAAVGVLRSICHGVGYA